MENIWEETRNSGLKQRIETSRQGTSYSGGIRQCGDNKTRHCNFGITQCTETPEQGSNTHSNINKTNHQQVWQKLKSWHQQYKTVKISTKYSTNKMAEGRVQRHQQGKTSTTLAQGRTQNLSKELKVNNYAIRHSRKTWTVASLAETLFTDVSMVRHL